MKKLKTRHKIGIAIVAMGLLALAGSAVIPSAGSYFVIAGIVLLLVGCFVVAPSFAF